MSDVEIQIDRNVARVTLNRPEVLNALSPDMARDLHHALLGLKEDEQVKCVLLRGAGRGFMAGGDIAYFERILPRLESGDLDGLDPIFEHVHGIVQTLRDMPAPVLAALHGAVAGFGVSLAAACDLGIAADDARFTLAYRHLGTSPDGGATHILPRVVGFKKAMELALLGERFSAAEALQWGLVNKVVAAAELETAVADWVGKLAAGPRYAQGRTKRLLYAALDSDFTRQVGAEERSFKACAQTADFAAGVRAFLDKRPARFE